MRNPIDISEDATIEAARAQREALEAINSCLLDLDVKALCFDPDEEYRGALKVRLVVDNEPKSETYAEKAERQLRLVRKARGE